MKTDLQLQQDVLDELKWDPSINAEHIGVAVNSGIVTLSGNVVSYLEKWAAEKAVGRVRGVKGIAEELEVTLIGSDLHPDHDIALAAANTLDWNSHLPARKVMVKVEKGIVTLQGEVDWNYQKEIAERAVAGLLGVKGVINAIGLKPHFTPGQVEDNIRKNFARRAWLNASDIALEVTDGAVALVGNVASWNDRMDATAAAWAAPGVTSVWNQLIVYP
jgi:osmotically-inducible protein OsmY